MNAGALHELGTIAVVSALLLAMLTVAVLILGAVP
jgi:hypothetical protein